MADIKISELTADTSPSTGDLIVTVSNASSNRKMEIGNLLTFKEVEFLPISWAIDGNLAPVATTILASSSMKIQVRNFDGSTLTDVQIPWQVPFDLSGSAVDYRVITFVTNSCAPSNNTWVFGMQGISLGDGDILGSTAGGVITSAATGRTDSRYDRVATAWSTSLTITNLSAGETANLKFYRDATNADADYGVDVGVFGIEIKYTRAIKFS